MGTQLSPSRYPSACSISSPSLAVVRESTQRIPTITVLCIAIQAKANLSLEEKLTVFSSTAAYNTCVAVHFIPRIYIRPDRILRGISTLQNAMTALFEVTVYRRFVEGLDAAAIRATAECLDEKECSRADSTRYTR